MAIRRGARPVVRRAAYEENMRGGRGQETRPRRSTSSTMRPNLPTWLLSPIWWDLASFEFTPPPARFIFPPPLPAQTTPPPLSSPARLHYRSARRAAVTGEHASGTAPCQIRLYLLLSQPVRADIPFNSDFGHSLVVNHLCDCILARWWPGSTPCATMLTFCHISPR